MLEHSELLLTVAEIAVAFAAFSGLVSVLGKAHTQLQPHVAANRLQSVLLTSLLATAFSLFPFLPTSFGANETATWRVSAGLFAASWLVYTISAFLRIRRLIGQGVQRITLAFLSWLNGTLYLVGIVALFVTSLGLFPDQIQGFYVFGLFVLLFTSGTVFVRLFLSLVRGESPAA